MANTPVRARDMKSIKEEGSPFLMQPANNQLDTNDHINSTSGAEEGWEGLENMEGADEKMLSAFDGLKKPLGQRNLKDQKAIIRLVENTRFMQKMKTYNKNLPNLVANCVKMEKIQKGKTVFIAGDKPEKLYFIVKGKVSVLDPKSKMGIQQEREQQSNPINLQPFFNQITSKFGDSPLKKQMNDSPMKLQKMTDENQGNHYPQKEDQRDEKKKKIESEGIQDEKVFQEISLLRSQIYNWKHFYAQEGSSMIVKYYHIKFLTNGEIFGDFGLLLRKPRSATILAVDDSFFLTISKQEYEELIREIQFNKLERKAKRLLQILKLDESKMKPEWINQIMINFSTKVKLKQGWPLYNEGDQTDSVYLIKSGEVALSKDLRIVLKEESGNIEYQYDVSKIQTEKAAPSSLESVSFQRSKRCKMNFTILSSNEFIGLEDLYMSKKRRSHSARCLNDVVAYFLKKSQIYRLIGEIYLFKLELQKQAFAKYSHHEQLIATSMRHKKENDSFSQKKSLQIKFQSDKKNPSPLKTTKQTVQAQPIQQATYQSYQKSDQDQISSTQLNSQMGTEEEQQAIKEFNMYKGINQSKEDDQQGNSNSDNPFWYDSNTKVLMDKKINFSIREKDPQYIQKVRMTFKGNIDSGLYGALNKKINRVISHKPRLLFPAFALPSEQKQANDQSDINQESLILNKITSRKKFYPNSLLTEKSSPLASIEVKKNSTNQTNQVFFSQNFLSESPFQSTPLLSPVKLTQQSQVLKLTSDTMPSLTFIQKSQPSLTNIGIERIIQSQSVPRSRKTNSKGKILRNSECETFQFRSPINTPSHSINNSRVKSPTVSSQKFSENSMSIGNAFLTARKQYNPTINKSLSQHSSSQQQQIMRSSSQQFFAMNIRDQIEAATTTNISSQQFNGSSSPLSPFSLENQQQVRTESLQLLKLISSSSAEKNNTLSLNTKSSQFNYPKRQK